MIERFFKLKINQYYLKKYKKKKNHTKIFEEDKYWKNILNFEDPDGKIRNLSLEKQKKLKDLKNEIRFIKSKFRNKKNKRIIDLGSGFGFFLSAFNNRWDKYGIELSEIVSKKSMSWAKIFKLDLQKQFDKKIIEKLGKFDVVFSYHVIEHLNRPENFIENVYKILKPDGYFILGTPNFDSACARRFKKNYRFYKDKTHISFFSENSLFRLLDDFGFKINFVDYPFFETEFFNASNMMRLFNKNEISPPFYGNIMTFYCKKKTKKQLKEELNYKNKRYQNLLKL